MASLAKMNLSVNDEVKVGVFNDVEFSVKQYLPFQEKVYLVTASVKDSVIDGYVNQMVLDCTLHFGIVELYTDLNITKKMKENVLETFDKIQSSGLLQAILELVPEDEYNYLFESALEIARKTDELVLSSVDGLASQRMNSEAILETIKGTTEENRE